MDASCDECLWGGKDTDLSNEGGVPVCPACLSEHVEYHEPDEQPEAVKIHVTLTGEDSPAGESLWAWRLGPNTAEVANIPFFAEKLCLGDIVSFKEQDGIREFVRVLKRKSRCIQVRYKDGAFRDLAERLRPLGMRVEGAFPGFASIAYPAKWEDGKLEANIDLVSDLLVEA